MPEFSPQDINALLALNSLFTVGIILFLGALLYDWCCRHSHSTHTHS